MKPRLPALLEAHDIQMKREGILFVGDQGCILADFRGANPELFSNGQRKPLRTEEQFRAREDHWLRACLGGEPSPGNFLNAGGITDTVNLGTVALRAGNKVLFDSEKQEVTNIPEANQFLGRDYREGWEL
jgi:hypothetical protein